MANLQLPHDHGQMIEHKLDTMPTVADCQTVAELFRTPHHMIEQMLRITCPGEESYEKRSAHEI